MVEKSYLERFAGKRIFVIDDEYFLREEVRRKLEALGAEIVSSAARTDQAFMLLDDGAVDAAILDIHLDDALVFSVAERLERMNVPFVFATALPPKNLPGRFTGFQLSEKPDELENIARVLFGPSGDWKN